MRPPPPRRRRCGLQHRQAGRSYRSLRFDFGLSHAKKPFTFPPVNAPSRLPASVATEHLPLVIAPAPPDTRKTPTRSIILLAGAGFASQAQVRVTDSLLPQIAADFGTTVGAAAMVVTAYALAHGSSQLLIGPVGDRYGKYRTIAVMALVSAILVVLCGLTQSLPGLALARLLAGASA